jgi:hypothetical protein
VRADQILAAQADLVRRSQEEPFVRYMQNCFTPTTADQADHQERLGRALPAKPTMSLTQAQMMVSGARLAEAYQVTRDMSMLVQHAASRLDDEDRWNHHLAPTSHGLVRFEQPVPVHEIRGRTMLAHWLLWGPCTFGGKDAFGRDVDTPGTFTVWFNDPALPDDVQREEEAKLSRSNRDRLLREIGPWRGFVGAEFNADGTTLGPPTFMPSLSVQAAIIADGGTPAPYGRLARTVHALWLMLGQTVAQTEEAHIRKSQLALPRQMGLPGKVTVISLRRTEGSRGTGETDVHWAHRWVVRGHWRWQPYGDGTRRRIWIAPFIKGPEGAPFVQSKKVYRLSR